MPDLLGSYMNNLKTTVVRIPILGCLILFFYRALLSFRQALKPLGTAVRWLFTSRETTNFTYDLELDSKRYLASMIADVTAKPHSEILGYIAELENDPDLREHIVSETAASDFSHIADANACFGRRIGWYAFVRALKPKVVVETGVDKGLGACVLTAALMRNRQEGFKGRYFGTDINSAAGYLLSGPYAELGTILYGDSIESLRKIEEQIDLFINDSDHSADYEAEEYEVIEDKLSEQAVIIGDNAHISNRLLEFALKTERHFLYYQEKPVNHWYPGAGIGAAFRRYQAM